MANVEDIMEGIVSAIMNFGAFVQLQDGTTGLVHISEISESYVKDVNDYLKVGQAVKVIAFPAEQDGKKRLSIKKATALLNGGAAAESRPYPPRDRRPGGDRRGGYRPNASRPPRPQPADKTDPQQLILQPPPLFDEGRGGEGAAFEDKLAKFMKDSEERLVDLKRQTDNKRGGGYIRKG